VISGINKCLEIVDDPSKIVMDIILLSSPKMNATTVSGTTLDNYMRYKEIKDYYHSTNAIVENMRSHPSVNYRYWFMPSKPLTSGLVGELTFNHTVIEYMIEVGKEDARHMLGLGEGQGFERLRQWEANKELLKSQYSTLSSFLYQKE